MRVVVSGGTGFIGRALCHALVARGDEVVILTRGPAHDFAHACAGCGAGGRLTFATWTPEAAGSWMAAIDGADAVVHLAGAGVVDERWTEERKAMLRSSRVASTELLSTAIARASKKPTVFISGSGVGHYGMVAGDRIVTEDDPAGDDFLAALTVDWEKAADAARAAGVRVCHPRFGMVLGRGGGAFKRFASIFRAFVGGPLGDGKQWLPWIHLRDTVRALEAMLDRPTLEGGYNVVGPEPATMNHFARALGEALHRPSIFRVPEIAVRMMLGEAAGAVLTGQRAMPKRLTDAGFAFVFPDLRSALVDLASPTAVPTAADDWRTI